MDRGIWAIWYEMPEEVRSEYLDWFHRVHIPEKLSRPGYLWAAHYELGHGGARFQKVVNGLAHTGARALGRGSGYLALFGGLTAHTFFNPSPGQLSARKLLATAGWGKHSILYEFVSLNAREAGFVPHEELAHESDSWTSRVLPRLVHAPCSPSVGRRIWPPVIDK
ncbi:MAG: hypothetical protein HY322_16510 [Betaproteobacteria bacterium]|nr:hypothetical protein [Betaproteobacteria bacterium]